MNNSEIQNESIHEDIAHTLSWAQILFTTILLLWVYNAMTTSAELHRLSSEQQHQQHRSKHEFGVCVRQSSGDNDNEEYEDYGYYEDVDDSEN